MARMRFARVRRAGGRRAPVVFVLFVGVLLAAAGVTLTLVMPPTYAASALVQLDPTETSVTDLDGELDDQEIATQTVVAESEPVASAVIERFDLDLSVDTLQGRVTAQQVNDSRILRITVTWGNALDAANVANAVSEEYLDFRDEQRDERLSSIGFVGTDVRSAPGGSILTPAVTESTPTGLNPPVAGLLSGGLGLLVGIVLVYARLALRGGRARARATV